MKDFVMKCLQFEPSKRWNVYELKKHPFFNDINNENSENSIYNISSRLSINSKDIIE